MQEFNTEIIQFYLKQTESVELLKACEEYYNNVTTVNLDTVKGKVNAVKDTSTNLEIEVDSNSDGKYPFFYMMKSEDMDLLGKFTKKIQSLLKVFKRLNH